MIIVREALSFDPRIDFSYLQILHDDSRGYSGDCFPKGVKSLLQLAKKQGENLKLLKTIDKINEDLMNHQKKV